MKKFATNLYQKLLSPSMRFELRNKAAWLRHQLNRACFWHWEISKFSFRDNSPFEIFYAGRKKHRNTINALLGIKDDIRTNNLNLKTSRQTVFVSEIPIPMALCVPMSLRTIVPLKGTIEEITAGCGSELRQRFRKYRAIYRIERVFGDAEIDRANREMLQPFARARFGNAIIAFEEDYVRQMARYGRLHYMQSADGVVACQLSCETYWAGKRYWSMMRCGYPESVYSDSKRLREVNTMNNYLELEWAHDNGYDYLDMQTSLGRPDDKVLQWKRRWGSLLDTRGQHGYIYVRLPSVGTPQFLWDAPLFEVKQHKLTLHLGLPNGPSDEEATHRYREMGFGGLHKVYLHCAKPPGEPILETLRSFYRHQKSPPVIEIIFSA